MHIGAEEDFGLCTTVWPRWAVEVAGETLDLLRTGEAPRLPQTEADATYAPSIRREELEVDWRRSAGQIACQIRAFSPRPGARTTHRGKLLKILAAHPSEEAGGIPGEIVEISSQGLRVQTGNASLMAQRVQPEGRTPMSASDYALGHRLREGEVLGEGTEIGPGKREAAEGARGVGSSDGKTLEERCEQAWDLKNQGEYEDAMSQFRGILQDSPSHARAHLGLGLVYCFVGLFDESIEEMKLAVECAPTWVDAHLNLAKTYAMLGQYDDAKLEFARVLELQPGHSEAKKQLAFIEAV